MSAPSAKRASPRIAGDPPPAAPVPPFRDGHSATGGAGSAGAPAGRGAAALRVDVMQQPLDVFWKDEGGRANHLVAVLTVHNVESAGGSVTVAPALCYENGQEVEDSDEIFKVLSVEPAVVTTSGQRVAIKFRIEKVSRRKDGRKFSLRASAVAEAAAGADACVAAHAYTVPITVLSKRKFPQQVTASPAGGPLRASVPPRKLSGVKRTSSVLQQQAHAQPPQQQQQPSSPPQHLQFSLQMMHAPFPAPQQQQQLKLASSSPPPSSQQQQQGPRTTIGQQDALAKLEARMEATVSQLQAQLAEVTSRLVYLERQNGKRLAVLDERSVDSAVTQQQSPLQHPTGSMLLLGEGMSDMPFLRLDDMPSQREDCDGDREDGNFDDASSVSGVRFDFGMASEMDSLIG